MKFRVMLKDSDAFYEAVQAATKSSVGEMEGLTSGEKIEVYGMRRDSLFASLARWVEYDEYVTIEFDTDTETATVVEVRP